MKTATGDVPRNLDASVFGAFQTRLRDMQPVWEEALRLDAQRAIQPPRVRPVGRDTPKGQHFIPRYWVVGFAEPAEKAGQVTEIDVSSPEQRTRRYTRRAASVEHMYTLADDSGQRTVVLEDALGLIEDQASSAFKKMAEGVIPGSVLESLDVSLLLAAQIVRTPRSLLPIDQAARGLTDRMIEMATHAGHLPPTEGALDVEINREFTLGVAFDAEALSRCAFFLFCRRWSLVRAAEGSCGFVLPERPVVMYSAGRGGFYGPGGVRDAHEVLVPVSRRVLLMMHWMDDSNPDGMEVPAGLVAEINAHLSARGGPTVFCAPSDAEAVMRMLTQRMPSSDESEEPGASAPRA